MKPTHWLCDLCQSEFLILLQFNLSESNEENIFKLMFKVSRDENNDQIFLEEEVTGIVRATAG